MRKQDLVALMCIRHSIKGCQEEGVMEFSFTVYLQFLGFGKPANLLAVRVGPPGNN